MTTSVTPQKGWGKTTLSEIEKEVMCVCDDNCGKMLSNCTCSESEKIRAAFTQQLKSGMTKDEIIAAYIGLHGEKALSAPTKSGFNLIAWVIPFVALVFGGWGMHKVISKWVTKGKKMVSESTITPVKGNTNAKEENYKNILEKELKNFE